MTRGGGSFSPRSFALFFSLKCSRLSFVFSRPAHASAPVALVSLDEKENDSIYMSSKREGGGKLGKECGAIVSGRAREEERSDGRVRAREVHETYTRQTIPHSLSRVERS